MALTIATIALVACAALVVWITTMHRSTVTIVAAMERLRIVSETEISLLVHATTDNPFVRKQLEGELSDRELVLTVADTGLGIAVEDQARLFEPFQRVGETRRVIAGVGLGLFMVCRIVEAHGGAIELASTPGVGSTFTVRIPRERVAACA